MKTQSIYDEISYISSDDYSYLKRNSDPLIKYVLLIIASLATIFIFLIIIFLFSYGMSFFFEIPLIDFLFGTQWIPSADRYGAFPLILGTLLLTMGAIIIAFPLGLGTAIFIAEITPQKVRKILKFLVEILAGIPSIVYGFFGIMIINTFIRNTFQNSNGYTWLSGSLILAFMALPTIVSVCEDAIRAVPNYYREGSYAMGATKWQTIRHVVLPAGMSGITAGIILGIGRALGETMAMMLVIGNSMIIPSPITNVFSSISCITAAIGLGWGPAQQGSLQQRSYVALGIILFIMTFIINNISVILLSRTRRKFTGEKKKFRFFNLKTTKYYILLKKYRRLLITTTISLIILLIFQDLQSRIIALVLWIFLSLVFYGMSISSKKNKKLIIYGIILTFTCWIFITWWGPFLAIFYTLIIFGGILVIRKLSSVNQQRLWLTIIFIFSVISILIVGSILTYIVLNGLPIITRPGYFTKSPLEGGIYPAIVGTIQLTIGSLFIALPLGIAAGIYLSEYAKEKRFTKIIRAGIDNLNGTPSIIFGLFGFIFFVIFLEIGRSLLAGMLTLSLMILPTIIRTTEEAIKAIPQSFREGSLALGSSKWQGITKIVIPAAIPGILTGAILGMGRSSGETAPIMFTATTATARYITLSLLEPVMALTYYLLRLLIEVKEGYIEAPGVALTLLLLVLIFYGIAFIYRNRYEKKKNW